MFLIFHALFADQPLKFCPFPNQTGKRVASRNDQTTEGRGGGGPTDDFTNETSTATDSII